MKKTFFLSIFFITTGCMLMSEQEYKTITRESYDTIATAYNENKVKLSPEQKAKAFVSYLPQHAKILDIGCGPGRDAKYFTELGFHVTGIDISEKMIELAHQNVPAASFEVMDTEEMQFQPASFDAVWASASLLHVPKDKFVNVLKQIRNIVKDDGTIYISMKQGDGEALEDDARYDGAQKFWSYYQKEELLSCVQEAGLSVIEHQVHDTSTSYQTHPWISVICTHHSHSITTRCAQAGDQEILYTLISELATFEKNTESALSLTKENLVRFGFEKNPYFFTEFAEVDGRVVGYALYYYGFSANLGRPFLYLEDLYVKPEWRRQKVARTLMKKLARYALEKECVRLEWHVYSFNTSARAFYDTLSAKAKDDLRQMRLEKKALLELAKSIT
jgi:SAM-dependent methyltransferase